MRYARLLAVLGVLIFCSVGSVVIFANSQMSEDEKAIRALGDRINLAWKCDNGPSLMAEVLSEKSFAFSMPDPQNPSRAVVLDRQGFLDAFQQKMERNRPIRHTSTMKTVTVVGPMGYVGAVIEEVSKNGKSQTEEALLFFSKEEAGWRLVYYAPINNIEQAVKQFRESGQ